MSEPHAPTAAAMLTGRVVRPTNRHYATGIHDDAVATDLGLRGGTIAGSAHLDTFVPLLIEQFGEAWFEYGNLSIYFRHATVDDEPVRALISQSAKADGVHVARIETEDGTLVGEGTAALSAAGSALRTRDLRPDSSQARILSQLTVGDYSERTTITIDGDRLQQRYAAGLITEVTDRYLDRSAVPPSAIVDAANDAAHRLLGPLLGDAVGMWGALEVGFNGARMKPDIAYEATITIPAISDSPQTELLWHDVTFGRPGGNAPVASVRILSRFMKASSPLWPTA
jgi:hypothetical protein